MFKTNRFSKLFYKYPKFSAIVISSLIATVVAFISRYLILSSYGLDIFMVTEIPFISIFALFNINFIRFSIKHFIEGILYEPHAMNISDILNTPSPPSQPSVQNPQPAVQNTQPVQNVPAVQNAQAMQNAQPVQNAQPAVQNAQPGVQNNGFTMQNNAYNIHDPTNIGVRGYIDPATGRPYPSSQPYAGNLSRAMQRDAEIHGNPTVSLNRQAFDQNSRRFYRQFMRHNYPNRDPNL
jgi:hypothetical protein